jgi:hypothetical protein
MGALKETELERRGVGEVESDDLQKDIQNVKVPYFRDYDPAADDGEDAIRPNIIISGILFALFVYLSPVFGLVGWGPLNAVFMAALSAVFIEFNSGMFHIVFDNEKFNTLPVLGPLAVDFQKHHLQPAGITKIPVFEFLQQVHAPALGIIGVQVILTHSCTSLRPFWFGCIFYVNMMFLAHRWSHILPKNNLPVVQWMQSNGLLLSMRQHIQHHKTYDCNFSIFTGWSNPFLNYVTKHWLGAEHFAWLPIYATYFLIPTFCYQAYLQSA